MRFRRRHWFAIAGSVSVKANRRISFRASTYDYSLKLQESGQQQPLEYEVVSNGRLYLRDQELIFCYDVKK